MGGELLFIVLILFITIINLSVVKAEIIDSYLDEGRTAFINDDYQNALILFDKALNVNSSNISAMNNKALTLLRLNRTDEAITVISRAANISPNDPGILANYGLILFLTGNSDAYNYLKRATEINPDLEDSWFHQGEILYKQKEYQKAIDAYKQVLKIQPKNIKALYNMGLCYESLEEYGEAVRMYDETVQIEPDFEAAWFNRGIIYDGFDNTTESINSMGKYIMLNQSNPIAWFIHGKGLARMGYNEEAKFSLQKAVDLDPKNSLYREYLKPFNEYQNQKDQNNESISAMNKTTTPIYFWIPILSLVLLIFFIRKKD